MPAYRVHIKNEHIDETVDVWEVDEAHAREHACDVAAAYSLLDLDDTTVTQIDSFIPQHMAWRVGDWIVCPWAVIHADYARVVTDYEGTLPDASHVDQVIQFLETAQAATAEPVEIRIADGRYSVVMRHADAERPLAVEFWLPAWEMGLDWGALADGEAFPGFAEEGNVHLLVSKGRVVGAVMGLRFDPLCHKWDVLWRAP